MAGWYFYLNKGKAVGPVDRAEVKSAIDRGQIGPFDLLYREGDSRWQASHEFPEFRSQFRGSPRTKIEDVWVILTRQETKRGMAYLQRGPFTTKQVQEQLQSGEIQYRDFIWKEGQDQWSRISSLENFNPPPMKWTPATKLPHDVDIDEDEEITADHPLDEVVTRTHYRPTPEAKPPEASTPDLTEAAEIPPATVRPVPRSPKQPTVKIPATRPPDLVQQQQQPWIPASKRLPMMRFAAGLASLAVIGFLIYHRAEILQLSGVKIAKEEEVVAPPAPPAPGKGGTRIKPTPAAQKAPAPPPAPMPPPAPEPVKVSEPEIPRVEPTKLGVSIANNESARPSAVFTTDGSHHYPIRVLVTGEAGDVLGQVSLYREVTVRWEAKGKPRLDFAGMNLGEGRYRMVARVNNLEESRNFRIGRDDRGFRDKIRRHRKLISLPFQRERRRLIRATSGLEQLASELRRLNGAPNGPSKEGLGKWRANYQEWVKEWLSGLDPNDPKSLVFPAQWRALREKQNDLFEVFQGLERNPNRPNAREDLQNVAGALNALVGDSQKLSLFR
jgi:hypothetical protein